MPLDPSPSDHRTTTSGPCARLRGAAGLWRALLGRQLRALRLRRGETLGEVAARANVSLQYLSEVERGIKEPSSEVIAAIAAALGVTLLDLTEGVAGQLRADRAPVHRDGFRLAA